MTGAASRVLITDQVFGGTTIERGVLEPLGVEVVEAPSADEATLVRLASRSKAAHGSEMVVGRRHRWQWGPRFVPPPRDMRSLDTRSANQAGLGLAAE